MSAEVLLRIGAVAHLGLMAAGILMPGVVGLREHLRPLPEFIRRLFWVYYTFIGLCLAGFGLGSFVLAEELASGTVLARAVCGFLAAFWTLRLVVATCVFNLERYLTDGWRRAGLASANLVFACLPLLYGWIAFRK
ncbi:MAG TPA: hypothetical protein VFR18_00950 [Terriglobia bacterium]|nr:hypothetical protein [Terriglobia bacterium]